MGKTWTAETSSVPSSQLLLSLYQASEEVIVAGGKSGGGNWWCQVLKLDSKSKTGEPESMAPHTVT